MTDGQAAQPETLELANELVRERLQTQKDGIERIEAKAAILLGFTAVAVQFVLTEARGGYTVAALVFYGVAFLAGVVAIALYETLVNDLRGRGIATAFAGLTLPNEASVALHEGVGFEPIGVFSAVGYKLGSWHDVGWWRLALRDELPVYPEPPASGRRGPLR